MFSSYNIHWNYGLLPQTWEDPSFANSEVEGALGDNDPGIPLITIVDFPLCHNVILRIQHNMSEIIVILQLMLLRLVKDRGK